MGNENRRPAIGRFVAVALVLPAVLTLVAVVVQLAVLPRVPETIATHWDSDGIANGFSPAWLQPLLTVLFGLGIPALISLTTLPGMRRGGRGVTYRFMGALAAATGTLVAVLFTWTFVIQIDAPDPAAVVLPTWPTLTAVFGIGIGVGVVAWFVQPREEPVPVEAAAAEPLALAPGERAVWMRTAAIARPGLIAITAAVILMCGIAVGAWVAGAEGVVLWVLTGVAALLVVLTATTTSFHVRVDEGGLAVDSVLGLPRFRVPLDAIERARTVEVNPMGEFGGWGLRLAVDGRFGVVLRSGTAIEVVRTGKRPFVVTVDDAQTGAALLEALRVRAG